MGTFSQSKYGNSGSEEQMIKFLRVQTESSMKPIRKLDVVETKLRKRKQYNFI